MAQTRTTSSRIQQHTIHSIQFYYSPANVMLVPHPCQVAQTICECCTHSPLGLRERPLSWSFYWKKVPISHTYLRTLHPFVNHCNEVNEQYHGGTSSITRRDVNQKSSIICSVQMINLNVVFSCGVWLKLATHPRSLHNFTQPASSRYAIWWRYNRDTMSRTVSKQRRNNNDKWALRDKWALLQRICDARRMVKSWQSVNEP